MSRQTFEDVELQVAGNHARITLARPERMNALTYAMIAELNTAIKICQDDPAVRSVIVAGAGRAFCVGDNLKGMGNSQHGEDRTLQLKFDSYAGVVKALRELQKPVITLAHGYALGAGLEIFMAGDIKITTADASLGFPFVSKGLVAMNYHLPRQIGFTRAARMLLTGEPIDGATAAAWALATEAVESDVALNERGAFWAEKFATLSTTTIGLMKETLYRSYELDEQSWFKWWLTWAVPNLGKSTNLE